jgi:hypothetical protein
MDAGGTATTECPPNKGSEWKHESPDFSRGESQGESGADGVAVSQTIAIHNSRRCGLDTMRRRSERPCIMYRPKKKYTLFSIQDNPARTYKKGEKNWAE